MKYDGIIIGGGPAGMFAAITAAEQGQRVLLIEKNDRLGKKLLITGKGRCNVTNNCSASEVLENIPRNSRFLFSAINSFPPEKIIRFFETNGCPLKTERGNRVFPVSDQSRSVLASLLDRMKASRVIVKNSKVTKLLIKDSSIVGVQTTEGDIQSHWVILATGGVSYPATGSTGDGYKMAEAAGHTIVPPEGSLVPLSSSDPACMSMQGLSLRNVDVKLVDKNGKLLYKDFGELLFTHFGVSGPTVLSASARSQTCIG